MVRGRFVRPVAADGVTPRNVCQWRNGDAADDEPAPLFSTLVSTRGEYGFAEMSSGGTATVIVSRIGVVRCLDGGVGRFEAEIEWGLVVDAGIVRCNLRPGRWTLRGQLFNGKDDSRGLLDDVRLSRELLDTGTAILPYCLTLAEVVRTQ